MNRGRRLVEVLKQPQYQPLTVEKQVTIIYAAGNGYLDSVEVEHVRAYETGLYQFLETSYPQLLTSLAEKKQIDDEVKAALKDALTEFGKQFAAGSKVSRRSACPHFSISAGASGRSSQRSRSPRR